MEEIQKGVGNTVEPLFVIGPFLRHRLFLRAPLPHWIITIVMCRRGEESCKKNYYTKKPQDWKRYGHIDLCYNELQMVAVLLWLKNSICAFDLYISKWPWNVIQHTTCVGDLWTDVRVHGLWIVCAYVLNCDIKRLLTLHCGCAVPWENRIMCLQTFYNSVVKKRLVKKEKSPWKPSKTKCEKNAINLDGRRFMCSDI